jgi:hypothetical protein
MATYSTNWGVIHPPQLGWQPIADTSTTQNHPLGTIVQARDKGSTNNTTGNGVAEFIYLKGVASTAVGDWVTYNMDDGGTTRLVANAIGPVAVAMSANVASQYGWYQIQGKAVANCLAAFADNGNVYATATAGSVDDAVVAGDLVHNAKGASAIDAPATGMAEFEIHRPWCDDDVDDNLGP